MKSPLAAFFALSLACAPALSAQQVAISEIEFESRNGLGQWIELVNKGSSSVDLGTWSLYHATQTPNKPQNYWWGFPRGTILAPGKFLRIHWGAALKASTATDIYTGNSVLHFLFGLGFEALDPNRGALAIMTTQDSTKVDQASLYHDWVSWGTTGFKRESIAIQAGRWTFNSSAPAATGSPRPTLAYDYTSLGRRHSGGEWFRDTTPTPLADNIGGAKVEHYGTACRGLLSKIYVQLNDGLPIHGNRDFNVLLDKSLGRNEFALGIIGVRGIGNFKLLGCTYWLDPTIPGIMLLVPETGGRARMSFGLPPSFLAGVKISTIFAVANVIEDRLGFTQGCEITFGK